MNEGKLRLLFAVSIIGFSLFSAGCTKDVYEPNPKPEISQELKDFGFTTRGTVKLSLDYKVPGFKGLIELYAENPIQDGFNTKKDGIKPVYAFYTDDNSKFEGSILIPKAVKELYAYTERWGLPGCVKFTAIAGGFTYDASQVDLKSGVTTRAVPVFNGSEPPYDFGYMAGGGCYLTTLFKWNANGSITGNPGVSRISKHGNETLGSISDRAQSHFDKTTDKRVFLSGPEITNITVKEDNTTLSAVFLSERGEYYNTVGYYYYKEGQAPTSREEMINMKKYIIFPNANNESWIMIAPGLTADLLFFGEKYDQPGTANFPKGYVIGWFFISNGFTQDNNIKKITPSPTDPLHNPILFSNDGNEYRRFVSLNDKKSGLILFGFEDMVEVSANDDFSDVFFYVKSNQDITNGDRPSIPEEKPEEKPVMMNFSGTLAFEDIWPNGGDYDMNDVAVEFDREVEADGSNNVTKVTEVFKFVQDKYAAQLISRFAYQVKNLGSVDAPGCTVDGTNSIIITTPSKEAVSTEGNKFVVTRTFTSPVPMAEFQTDFNPFIIVGDNTGQGRKEVHLPNFKPTELMDMSLVGQGNDAYFMDADGKYSFAIEIPIKDFKLSLERQPIGETYPAFKTWAGSKGKDATDWYLK